MSDKIEKKPYPAKVKMLNGETLIGTIFFRPNVRPKDDLNGVIKDDDFIALTEATDGKDTYPLLLIYKANIAWISLPPN